MPVPRCSNEQIIAAYRDTGSIWKAAKAIGLSGQQVHERLRAMGYPLSAAMWTDDEHEELVALAEAGCSIGEIARRLGRPYHGVALKLSRLKIGIGSRHRRARPPTSPYTKALAAALARELRHTGLSLRQYARQKGLSIDQLAVTLQRFEPAFWQEWTKTHGMSTPQTCPNCGREFYALTKKQRTCSKRCTAQRYVDEKYFGGRRNTAIGLAEGICQLCEKSVTKGLTAHHVLGKEHDPENQYLIALCRGCHKIVELLWPRQFTAESAGWENLISLVVTRRLAQQSNKPVLGAEIDVEMTYFSEDEAPYVLGDDAAGERRARAPRPTTTKPRRQQPNLLDSIQ